MSQRWRNDSRPAAARVGVTALLTWQWRVGALLLLPAVLAALAARDFAQHDVAHELPHALLGAAQAALFLLLYALAAIGW